MVTNNKTIHNFPLSKCLKDAWAKDFTPFNTFALRLAAQESLERYSLNKVRLLLIIIIHTFFIRYFLYFFVAVGSVYQQRVTVNTRNVLHTELCWRQY